MASRRGMEAANRSVWFVVGAMARILVRLHRASHPSTTAWWGCCPERSGVPGPDRRGELIDAGLSLGGSTGARARARTA
ncbi:hypothetical protein GCM10010392_25120 [Streptomyces clavifer]|nr:hypothetical protein GCM10010392_25120 [Streptomyces clavifer]